MWLPCRPLLLYLWRTGKASGVVDGHVHYQKREIDGKLAHHERRPLAIPDQIKANICLSTVEDYITTT